jgi:RNA polymerase sigma-70 factor (ECF subfamily)
LQSAANADKEDSLKDSDIIELYWQRDERALAETENRYGLYCLTIANNILGCTEDAEECVSDTWLKAWNTIPPCRPDRFGAFLGRITRNSAFDKLRYKYADKRGGGEMVLALEELGSCISDIQSSEYKDNELADCINRFLGRLSARDRRIFIQRYWYVCSIKQIADSLNLKEGTVKVSLSRNRERLRKFLEKEDIVIWKSQESCLKP